MDIVVFGAGSLGSLLGGLLAREHAVTLVGREAHVRAVKSDGLLISGEFDLETHPVATTDGTWLDADLALVTVKAYDTREAAETLGTGNFDAVCSLQNGLGNEAILAAHVDRVLAGTATYGARLVEPGHVECTGVGEVVVGEREGGTAEVAARVGSAFQRAGIDTLVAGDMPRRIWAKLAVNAGINAVTALARVENGALADSPGRDLARTAAREVARVARAEGVTVTNREAVAALEQVVADTAANTSSMHQDVLAGRRTEVGAIYGAVVDRARTHGIEVPVTETLSALVRTWEAGAGVAGDGGED